MLIRISLIIAVVAALAAAVLNFVGVKDNVDKIVAARNDEKSQKEKAQGELASTKKTLSTTQSALNTVSNLLIVANTELQKATVKATEQEKRASDLQTQLDRTRGERDAAQQELNQFAILGVNATQVKALIAELKKTKQERDTFIGENTILAKRVKKLESDLDKLIGQDKPVVLPAGLKGTVVAVDPKYDFVVLDIGGNQGVLERGEMMISRHGQLIGKIRISSVQPTRCVANILPEWKKGEVMEGDQVIY
jgi:hypothetical protein